MRAWEPEEDQTIIELLDKFGPKWSKIVQQLPGRSVSSVRNRWQRIEKGRKLRMFGQESKNRCQQCGEPKRGHVCMARLKNRGEGGTSAEEAALVWREAHRGDPPPTLDRMPSYSSLPRVAANDDNDSDPGGSPPLVSVQHSSSSQRSGELGFESLLLATSVLRERESGNRLAFKDSTNDRPALVEVAISGSSTSSAVEGISSSVAYLDEGTVFHSAPPHAAHAPHPAPPRCLAAPPYCRTTSPPSPAYRSRIPSAPTQPTPPT